MNLVKTLAAAFLMLSGVAIHAEESWHINLHTVSQHFSDRKNGKDWNQENFGLGIRKEFNEDIALQGGFYKNSINKWSTYAVADYTPLSFGNWKAGVSGGVRTNYTKPVMAAAGGVLRWQGERYSVAIRLTPKIADTCAGFVGLELGWKL